MKEAQSLAKHNGERRQVWFAAGVRALPAVVIILTFFTVWFAFADRYIVFLYFHDMGAMVPDTTPFSPTTSSRYWMAGLVAGGVVMMIDWVWHWLRGQWHSARQPASWFRTWLLAAIPIVPGVLGLVSTVNTPTLPWGLALKVTAVTMLGLAVALMPGQMIAKGRRRFFWWVLDGWGVAAILLFSPKLEDAWRWSEAGRSWLVAVTIAGVGAGILWLILLTGLRHWRRRNPDATVHMLIAGMCIAYLLLPLTHYVVGTNGYFYISNAANFFGLKWGYQLLAWMVTAVIALGINRWRMLWR